MKYYWKTKIGGQVKREAGESHWIANIIPIALNNFIPYVNAVAITECSLHPPDLSIKCCVYSLLPYVSGQTLCQKYGKVRAEKPQTSMGTRACSHEKFYNLDSLKFYSLSSLDRKQFTSKVWVDEKMERNNVPSLSLRLTHTNFVITG